MWVSWVDHDRVIISYQAPQTDNVLFSITCNLSDGTGLLNAGAPVEGVKDGGRISFTLRGSGGTASYTGIARLSEMNGAASAEVALPSARAALVPLSRPGTLTVQYPANSYRIPIKPKAAQVVQAFRSQCPSSGGGHK
jgi:hypothetical protein